ncbi:MAG: hypothetical protein H0V17_12410, partial [Deltaproteobacteria bacterium]|nr:hypothetical protein [Deltaproteobacteria bacterium]
DQHGQLAALAMTERFIFLSGGGTSIYVVDGDADRPAVDPFESGGFVEHLAIGSDHLVAAGRGRMCCFRGR